MSQTRVGALPSCSRCQTRWGAGMNLAAVAALVGTALLVGPTPANASAGSLESQWRGAARITTHTAEYRNFCVQHRGNDHYWREGFCQGDLRNYPDYGKLS